MTHHAWTDDSRSLNRAEATLGAALRHDDAVMNARSAILDALKRHQAGLTGPKAAESEPRLRYEDLLSRFAALRGGDLYYPYLSAGMGRGALVELADGSVKYDMISGIGVHGLGHSHPLFVEAGIDAALDDTVMQGNLQQNVETARLAERMLHFANRYGAGLDHCFFTSSGAMANENALKLVFHQKQGANRVLAFENCFAGRTLALSDLTDRPAYRVGLPDCLSVDYIPFYDASAPAESTGRSLCALKQFLDRYPGKYGCLWLELVQGEGGYYPGSHDYFVKLIEVCKSAGVPVIADEVQTFGRTGEPFAFQTFEINTLVDVVTVGKMSQVCATLFRDSFKPKPGIISQTFTSSSSAIHAGLALFRYFERSNPFGDEGEIKQLHRRFVEGFEYIKGKHPQWIHGPYGIGTMIAFTPFDGDAAVVKKLLHRMFEKGLVAFLAGQSPSRIRFLPPLDSLSERDINAVLAILEESLAETAVEEGIE